MAGIKASIGGDASQGYRVLDQFAAKAENVAQKIARGFQERIGHRMFDGLMRAARALPDAMKSAIDAGGRLSDQMARTGAAGEGLLVLERLLQNNGIAAEKTTILLGQMQRAFAGINEDMKETGDAFRRLNLDMETLRQMDPTQAFMTIGKAIMAIQDPAERTAVAMRIFGRSGAAALVAFSEVGGIERATKELGAMPEILAANADRLDMVSDRLAAMGTGWQQIGAAAASAVLPALERITSQIASMDLTRVGESIGRALNILAKLAPTLVAVGAAMVGLKITAFVGALAMKTRAWWAQTAAIKANTAALAANAVAGRANAAGQATGGGVGRAGMLAGGGAMLAGVLVQQAMISHAERLREANDAATSAIDRGNAAMQKFEMNAIRAQVATREEVEATIAAIEDEKKAILAAADADMLRATSAAARAEIEAATETTLKLLDQRARFTRQITDAQLEANAATRAASQAEMEHAEAVEKSIEAYEKLRAEFAKRMDEAGEKADLTGPLRDQLAELDRAESEIRAKMSRGFGGLAGADIIAQMDANSDIQGTDRARDLEQAMKLVEIEARRNAITDQHAASRRAIIDEYREEMGMLAATVRGEDEKLAALEREAEIRAEIARLMNAGFSRDEATAGAQNLVDARLAAEAAREATEAEERRNEARARGRDITLDAYAAAQGADAAAERAIQRRAAELADQSGLDRSEAEDIARNESALAEISRLRNEIDRASGFQSTLGAVSDMQRIGGGGSAIDSGLDIARQQADLQREMVSLLAQIATRTPEQSLEF